MRWLIALILVAPIAAVLASCASPGQPGVYVVPSGVPTDCSVDSTNAIQAGIDAVPNGATVNLPAHGCFRISNTITVQNKTALTVNGNGATLELVNPNLPSFAPIVNLFSDSELSVHNVTLVGTYTGNNGGAGTEGDYGVALESDHNVTITDSAIEKVQGDFVYLEPGYDTTTAGINTGITFNHDSFLYAGYHGFTIEAANGFVVENSTVQNVGLTAVDAEVDVGGDSTCRFFCASGISLLNNIWSNWQGDWYASLQGGIPENNLTIVGNTFTTTGIFMEVGLNPGDATNWDIHNNSYGPGAYAYSYHGGGSADMQIQEVTGLQFYANQMPDCPGTDPPACDGGLVHYAVQAIGVQGKIAGNNFTGNLGVIQPSTNQGNTIKACWNKLGPTGHTFFDGGCT